MQSLVDIITNIRTTYLKIDPNAKVWDNNVLKYYANRGYSKVQMDFKYDIAECQATTIISTVQGTQEYTKPSDLVRVTGFLYNTQPLTMTNKQYTLLNQGTNSIPNQYYTYGDKIGLYPTPDSSYSLQLLYNKKLPKLTSVVGSALDDDMNDLVVLWSCYLMFLSVEKVNKANMCLTQYTIAKDGLLGEKMYDDDNIRFDTQRSRDIPRDNVL